MEIYVKGHAKFIQNMQPWDPFSNTYICSSSLLEKLRYLLYEVGHETIFLSCKNSKLQINWHSARPICKQGHKSV